MYLHVSNVDERDLCPPLLHTAQWESVLVVGGKKFAQIGNHITAQYLCLHFVLLS